MAEQPVQDVRPGSHHGGLVDGSDGWSGGRGAGRRRWSRRRRRRSLLNDRHRRCGRPRRRPSRPGSRRCRRWCGRRLGDGLRAARWRNGSIHGRRSGRGRSRWLCGGRAAPSGAGDPVDSRPPMSRRRSIRSRRAAYPSGPAAPGSRRRAMSSSSCKRGAVAPVISASPALTTSAARERPPVPNAAAWTCIRSS